MQTATPGQKCGACGREAVEPIWIDVGTRTLVKWVCPQHLEEILAGGRRGPETEASGGLLQTGVAGRWWPRRRYWIISSRARTEMDRDTNDQR
jgi:hypothetical protein